MDTAIWIDLYENRKGYLGEPLGEYAFSLFKMIKSKNCKIVVTDLILIELEMNYSLAEINGMMKPFEGLLEKFFSSEEQWAEAKRIAGERKVPKGDAMHAILARDNGFVLVSRDRHFKGLADISSCYKPEEII